MDSRPLKEVDVLRHELKALRYLLDNFHVRRLELEELPARDDFQSEQTRAIYDAIVHAPTREIAQSQIGEMELEDVDTESFLRLSGEHYYTYPALVRERAAAIRSGRLKVVTA
jgi:hypothetical protein